MDNISEVLKSLRERQSFVSGDHISAKLKVSRTAVWKYMNQLERCGYVISKAKGKGYMLVSTPDKLYSWEIDRYRDTSIIGQKIIYKENVDSTNTLAFKLAMAGEVEGACVIAESQERGKGRLGRRWCSTTGRNIYLSVIVRPRVHPSQVYPITFLSSLAAFDTVYALTSITPTLKWPNDVLLSGRKVCGTLLELSTEADMVRFVVIGIGLNVNMREDELDAEIREKAGSLSMATKKVFERASVCGMLLSNLEKYYLRFREQGAEKMCRLWEERAGIKGKYLEITQMGETHKGVARGVDKDGAILLDIDGITKKIIAGDVSY
ncbi:MAG TPA: biotin--[acetyl-CoA-carboxylase] ligase [Syntrophorhabdaceae bacterium]|nr:biotin--[acetyl-CoA-carboxylase] ligase [Syntrophorhabdaceae bacterium]